MTKRQKYLVTITEVLEYVIPVTARDEDHAEQIAERKIINTRGRDKWVVNVPDRTIDNVSLEKPTQ